MREAGIPQTSARALAEKQAEHIVQWIRDWLAQNGPTASAVIGISGGKDSTITAALPTKALGPERVVGVLMPNGVPKDINDAKRVVEFLGIKSVVINIEGALTLPMAKARGFSVHRLQPAPCEGLHNLPERIGLGVSHPTVDRLRQ